MANNSSDSSNEVLNGVLSSFAGLLSQQVKENLQQTVEMACKEAQEMTMKNVQELETKMTTIEANDAHLHEEVAQLKEKIAQLEQNVTAVVGGGDGGDDDGREEFEQKQVNYWDKDATTAKVLDISNYDSTVEMGCTIFNAFLSFMMRNKVLGGQSLAKFPLQKGGYFEVKLLKLSRVVFIGLISREKSTKRAIALLTGPCIATIGAEKGEEKKFGLSLAFGRTFETRTVGCGVTPNGQLFFTLNGLLLKYNTLFTKVNDDVELYPAVILFGMGTRIEANFGGDPTKPFLFKLDEFALNFVRKED